MGFERINETIKNWGQQALRKAKTEGRSKGIRHRSGSPSESDSLEAMTISYKKRAADMITAIVFNLRRSMFYVRAGAGRGYGGAKGSNWTNAEGERKRTDPTSLGKAGISPRAEKDFLKDAAETSQSLIDQVALQTMDEIFNQAFNSD
ncbi:hypothetical protein [Chitinophaga ginsengisegetis]|uniref:hypothetical protein n=1 Tax=Chitinophaga ginsengisegetis TaxID=393003 RepID=UPI000DB94B3C|nr:hypothetical protein [Chitinophaga ginsengisegetis]MDR6565462.1 hypothetical protein [Chitinophaga ginsengisegetis]MDR6645190.1 hypothetical protein [Chitinophaga ginsengisegetis]MDR6652218.1 hypothetical protein [Chitinophaga ginsengisegetis]